MDNDIGASTRSTKRRPDYERMMADARTGEFDVILAYTSGRLTRRPREHEDQIELAERYGIRFEYVASPSFDLNTSAGRRVARILAANDTGESEDIAERVSRAARQRAEKGEWHGGRVAPPGYELIPAPEGSDRKYAGLRLDPVQAPLLQEGAKRLLRGESLYAVCNDWNTRGLTTRDGARWVSATLRRSLLSPTSIGKRAPNLKEWKYGEPLYDTDWPSLLKRDDWNSLHELMGDPKRRFQPLDGSYAGKRPLGGGVTVCGNTVTDGKRCGKKLVSQKHRGVVAPHLLHGSGLAAAVVY